MLNEQKVPVFGTWDDHDYGVNNGEKDFRYKKRNRKMYMDFLNEPTDSERYE